MSDTLTLPDGATVTIRPIRPTDAGIEQEFVARLSDRARRYRFLSGLKELTPAMLRRFIDVDFPQELALIATVPVEGRECEVAVARYAGGSAPGRVEFAVVVADDWQRKGIGRALLERLFAVAREQGFAMIEGLVLRENLGMLKLMDRMGFQRAARSGDPGVVYVSKALSPGETPTGAR